LEERGWIRAKWGVSENNRRARYYELSGKGAKRLEEEAGRWRRMVAAVTKILGPEYSEG
jgi:DNA-binding PadR family transcriptional regulator